MTGDLRIFFLGDSFVQGIGDPEYRGWVGRVLAASGTGLTGFNLGIRGDSSDDVLARYRQEITPRLRSGDDHRLVVSFGSNDAVEENGVPRVPHDRCLDNLATLLTDSHDRDIRAFVVGPPPVVDGGRAHLDRTTRLADAMAALCRSREVPFISTTAALAADPDWVREAMATDGAHPGAGGYRRLADLVLAGAWHEWLARPEVSDRGH